MICIDSLSTFITDNVEQFLNPVAMQRITKAIFKRKHQSFNLGGRGKRNVFLPNDALGCSIILPVELFGEVHVERDNVKQ